MSAFLDAWSAESGHTRLALLPELGPRAVEEIKGWLSRHRTTTMSPLVGVGSHRMAEASPWVGVW